MSEETTITSKGLKESFQEATSMKQVVSLMPALMQQTVIDIAEILSKVSDELLVQIFDFFTIKQQGFIFSEFPIDRQYSYQQSISKKKFAVVFEEMPSDDRVDLYQMLSLSEQNALLPFLSKRIREDVLYLNTYPEETAGSIMSTDFATVQKDMTCSEAMDKVRLDAPSKTTVYYIYVVDEEQEMQGFITLKDLILANPNTLVKHVLHSQFVYGNVEDKSEDIAKMISKYDLVAIPILNELKQLVGIVTHDEAIDVIRAEHTEDMERFMGILSSASEELEYNKTTVWMHFKKRIVWLASLAAIGTISGYIIHRYEAAFEQMIILAFYMPMIADAGGNSGSQSATVVIRALSLGQIKMSDWLRVIWTEFRISILLALCLGVLAYARIAFLSHNVDIPPEFSLFQIGIVISLALSVQIVSSALVGAGLPLIVRVLGGDPAVAASPAITTIVDITGLLIYFSLATSILGL